MRLSSSGSCPDEEQYLVSVKVMIINANLAAGEKSGTESRVRNFTSVVPSATARKDIPILSTSVAAPIAPAVTAAAAAAPAAIAPTQGSAPPLARGYVLPSSLPSTSGATLSGVEDNIRVWEAVNTTLTTFCHLIHGPGKHN